MSKTANAHDGWFAVINMNIIQYNWCISVISVACASGWMPLMDLQAIVLYVAEGLNNTEVTLCFQINEQLITKPTWSEALGYSHSARLLGYSQNTTGFPWK